MGDVFLFLLFQLFLHLYQLQNNIREEVHVCFSQGLSEMHKNSSFYDYTHTKTAQTKM